MQTIGERILEIKNYYFGNGRGSNVSFAKKLGVRGQVVSNWFGRGDGIGTNVINQILETFPEVDKGWLIGGNGNMLKSSSNPTLERLKERVAAFEAMTQPIVQTAERLDKADVRGVVERWAALTTGMNGTLPKANGQQPEKGALRAFLAEFKAVARKNPSKALWVITGEENNNLADAAELMLKDNQVKGLRIVNASLEAENEMLKQKIKELTAISEQLSR